MTPNSGFDWALFFQILLGAMGLSLILAIGLLIITYRHLRNLKVPPNADFFTTLRHVPLYLVIILDLLDFGLDILATPFTWILLSSLGLQSLRMVTAIEGLIPGTQMIPTLTVAWILARLGFNLPASLPPTDYPRRDR